MLVIPPFRRENGLVWSVLCQLVVWKGVTYYKTLCLIWIIRKEQSGEKEEMKAAGGLNFFFFLILDEK